MLNSKQIPNTNILEITVNGPTSQKEFDATVAIADDLIDQYGKIKLIEIIHNIGKIEPSALWADLKWAPRHIKRFSHICVVADQKWIKWMVGPMKPFFKAEIRCYHLDQIDEARAWLEESQESPVS